MPTKRLYWSLQMLFFFSTNSMLLGYLLIEQVPFTEVTRQTFQTNCSKGNKLFWRGSSRLWQDWHNIQTGIILSQQTLLKDLWPRQHWSFWDAGCGVKRCGESRGSILQTVSILQFPSGKNVCPQICTESSSYSTLCWVQSPNIPFIYIEMPCLSPKYSPTKSKTFLPAITLLSRVGVTSRTPRSADSDSLTQYLLLFS